LFTLFLLVAIVMYIVFVIWPPLMRWPYGWFLQWL
jgi:hypothetical protein